MTQPVVWRLASAFPRSSDTIWWAVEDFAARVAELTDDGLRILPMPANEPHAPAAITDLVAAGEIECGQTAGSFLIERDPVLSLLTFLPFGMDARRQRAWLLGPGAGHAHAAWGRQGVMAIPFLDTGAQAGGWFRTPMTDPAQFAGLRIRTAGLPARVFARLGAEPQNLGADTVLDALQSGALDAADWIGPHDDRALGFHRIAPFYHFPGVLEPCAQLSLVIAPAAWETLPDGWRAALVAAAAASEQALIARYDRLNPRALAALRDEGATLVRFPTAVIAALRMATEAVLAEIAAADPRFAAAIASWRAFEAQGRDWAAIGEMAVAATILGDLPL